MWHIDLVNSYARYCGIVDGVVYRGKYNGEEYYETAKRWGYNMFFIFGAHGTRMATPQEINEFIRSKNFVY